MENTSKNEVKHQDPIQSAIGSMGRWQIIIAVVLSLKSIPIAWNQFSISVLAPRQDFTCISPSPFNSSDSMLRACYVKINESLPEVRCDKFSYDDSVFKSTIVSEWDLVCDRKHLLRLVQPLTQAGILLGKLFGGIVADKIGRRTPLITAVTIQAIAGIITPFMPTFELFLLFKVLSAFAAGGTMIISIVIVMEIIGAVVRSKVIALFGVPFLFGIFSIPLFSHLTRTWDGFWLMIAVPAFGLLSYYWLVPESPRWLLAVGRVEEARQVLLQAAKKNKIPEKNVTAAIEAHEKLLPSVTKGIETDNKQRSCSIIDLVRTPNMRIKTLFIMFNWFKSGMVYYGIKYYQGRMSQNVLSDLAISAIFDTIGHVIAYILISRVTRLKILMTTNVLSGISLLLIIPFYNDEMIKLILISICVTCMTVGLPAIHLYTGELFPTVIRNIGFSICSVAAKLGSIVAPLMIDYTGDIAFWIVPVVLGLSAFLGAIFLYWLPETMNCPLPQTIEDCENFRRKTREPPTKC